MRGVPEQRACVPGIGRGVVDGAAARLLGLRLPSGAAAGELTSWWCGSVATGDATGKETQPSCDGACPLHAAEDSNTKMRGRSLCGRVVSA